MRLSTFVGIDQTGAAVRGVPAPLPIAALLPDGALVTGTIPRLDRSSIEAVAGSLSAEVAVVVDAVLGMPSACWEGRGPDDLWRLFARTHETPGYGRVVAETFFAPYAPTSGALPRRACEIAANANSVLASRPYQKNIQTGTFRVWKDLTSAERRWVNVWPYEDGARARVDRPWLFEGYPSWMWTRLFGFPSRQPGRIRELVARAEARGVAVRARRGALAAIARDPDLADAVALAVGGACLEVAGALREPFPGFARHRARRREGWIAGVAQDSTRSR